MIPESLFTILRSSESKDDNRNYFPPTEVFNEGWMLRLVLYALQTVDVPGHPLKFLDNDATWYSEARLISPFLRKPKKDLPGGNTDTLGEGYTNADGVIGHFGFDPNHKAKLELRPGTRQFIVVEAKMFSNLSSGTTHAPGYNQAARTVACMAKTIELSGIPLDNLDSVGFFVVAPNREMRKQRKPNTNLEICITSDSIRSVVSKRIEGYETPSRKEAGKLRKWEKQYCSPLVDRPEKDKRLSVLSWEQIIKDIADIDPAKGEELLQFYQSCLKYA